MTGLQECPAWLQTDWILGQFGDDRSEAVARYVNFVRAGVGLPSVWDNVQGQVFLGSESFHKRMLGLSEKATISEIPRTQRRPPGCSLSEYRDQYAGFPKMAMAAAYASGSFTMLQIADFFGVHYATVSRAVKGMDPHKNFTAYAVGGIV